MGHTPVTSSQHSTGSTLGLVPFSNFISDLEEVTEDMLVKSANDKLVRVNTLEGTTVIQRDPDRLEEQANGKIMDFNKGNPKCCPWAGSTSARAQARHV